MVKLNLKSPVRPKIFWASIVILLILCVSFYILKEKEKARRMAAEKILASTIEAKRLVENKLTAAKEEIADREEEIKNVLDKLEKEINTRKEAEVRLISTIQEKRDLEEKIKELSKNQQVVELEKIVVVNASEVTGKVLSVDKENTFIVIDLGRTDNLNISDVLAVYRNDEFIGKVEVEKVEDETSAAVILPEWQGVEFEENDVVKNYETLF